MCVEFILQEDGDSRVHKDVLLGVKGHPPNNPGMNNFEVSIEDSQRQVMIKSSM